MKEYVKALLIAHFLIYVSIGFDISIARQVFCFLYLTFVPGFLILKVLKFQSKKVDVFLFSVGLSVASLMFLALIMGELASIFGYSTPLSVTPLVVTISGFTLAVLFIGCRQDFWESDNSSFLSLLNRERIPFKAVFLILLPALSIVGAMSDNVFLLLAMIVGVALLYGVSISSRASVRLYVLIIFMISLALLFHTTFISKYLVGWDIHLENYVFKTTESEGSWSSPGVGVYTDVARFESVLSITVLPTIYTNEEILFKIIYPFIFALVPLALYRVYESQMNKKFALLSVFFFMSASESFFGAEPLSLARQMIGELFLVLSILLIVDKKIPTQKKRILFLIFGAAIVVSHYALSYFYIVLIFFTFIFMRKWREPSSSKELVGAVSVLLLFAMTFTWYLYVSDAPLMKLSADVRRIYYNFVTDILNPRARSPQLTTLTSVPSNIVSTIHRIVFYVQNIFIFIGVAELFLKKKKSEFDPRYRFMAILCMLIMLLCLAIPNLATSFQLTRFYAITIIFLAPFFCFGGIAVFNLIKNLAKQSVSQSKMFSYLSHRNLGIKMVSFVLILSFLFSVGFIDHITGTYPESLSLDKDRRIISNDIGIRTGSYTMYIPDQDVSSAIWLSQHISGATRVYADEDAKYFVLLSYGLIPLNQTYPLLAYATTRQTRYAYLASVNIKERLIVNPSMTNLTDVVPALDFSNKIYSNGASEIYYSPGR
jgi:uncharacterized membrane protein